MYAIEDDPNEAFPSKDTTNVQFKTGDPIIDDWEKKRAEGRFDEIDWDAGVDPDFLKRFKAYTKRSDEEQFPEIAASRLKAEPSKLPVPANESADFLSSLVGGFDDSYDKS